MINVVSALTPTLSSHLSPRHQHCYHGYHDSRSFVLVLLPSPLLRACMHEECSIGGMMNAIAIFANPCRSSSCVDVSVIIRRVNCKRGRVELMTTRTMMKLMKLMMSTSTSSGTHGGSECVSETHKKPPVTPIRFSARKDRAGLAVVNLKKTINSMASHVITRGWLSR